jgi:hypothetical protein
MPPSGKCQCPITPAAAMVDNLKKEEKKPGFRTVDQQKKAKQFQDLLGTLYSCPGHD